MGLRPAAAAADSWLSLLRFRARRNQVHRMGQRDSSGPSPFYRRGRPRLARFRAGRYAGSTAHYFFQPPSARRRGIRQRLRYGPAARKTQVEKHCSSARRPWPRPAIVEDRRHQHHHGRKHVWRQARLRHRIHSRWNAARVPSIDRAWRRAGRAAGAARKADCSRERFPAIAIRFAWRRRRVPGRRASRLAA
ncbi:MAG: hypothetical protein BWZ10_00228 [candidate division BRC1 bacterium ADurb.BinA364]|nr:MAG: hypothetical protein BWZ10_00228 [candidate division BRC1 bacterium ADurb.BinA364]